MNVFITKYDIYHNAPIILAKQLIGLVHKTRTDLDVTI